MKCKHFAVGLRLASCGRSSSLRTAAMAVALGMVAGGATITFPLPAVAATAAQKVIQGKVLGDGDAPAPGAIVYLKNGKSNDIKSYIAGADGGYRFGQLATDTDYTVWAELHGKKSATKTITAFNNKKQFDIDLRLK